MMDSEFFKKNGYSDVRMIQGKGWCGLRRFIFTTGLVVGIDEVGYVGRYCYKHHAGAKEALKSWSGKGDPDGQWIKYKGIPAERSNPKYETENTE